MSNTPLHSQAPMSPFQFRRPASGKPKKVDTAARVAKIVGESLREIRRQQGHSLDTLALASGVSRAMLGQIETGKSVPTITVLWKIADALRVPVAQLISDPEAPQFSVLRRAEARTAVSPSGNFEVRPIALSGEDDGLDFEEIRVAPGHGEEVPQRRGAARARLIVASGSVEVRIGEANPVLLAEGDAIFFPAALRHVLSNPGQLDAILYLVIAPQRNGR